MPVQILLKNDNAYAPTVVCDFCGEEIIDAKTGNYQWFHDERDNPERELFFVHKLCSNDFEVKSGRRPKSGGLEAFMVFLAHNLKLQPTNAEQSAYIAEGKLPPSGLS